MSERRLPVYSGMVDGRPLIADLMARARIIADARPSGPIASVSAIREAVYAEALKQLKEAVSIGREIEGRTVPPAIDVTLRKLPGAQS